MLICTYYRYIPYVRLVFGFAFVCLRFVCFISLKTEVYDPPVLMPFHSILLCNFTISIMYYFSFTINRYKLRNEMRKEGNDQSKQKKKEKEKMERATQLQALTSCTTSVISNYIIIKFFVSAKVNYLYTCDVYDVCCMYLQCVYKVYL